MKSRFIFQKERGSLTILALDASGPACSVALVREKKLVYESLLIREKAHASHLAPMLREALMHAGAEEEELACVACVVGPGSFTGVRIGVAAAQGFAFGRGIPCAPVNALEALAAPHAFDGLVCPLLDARGGQVYAAAFQGGTRVMEDRALSLAEYLDALERADGRLLFTGDGVSRHRAAIGERLGDRAMFLSEPLRASAAAFLALENSGAWINAAALRPLYLRAPQAERERAAREKGNA